MLSILFKGTLDYFYWIIHLDTFAQCQGQLLCSNDAEK